MRALAEHAVVDYWRNHEAMNATRVATDHFLYDVIGGEFGLALSAQQMDAVVEQCLQLARRRGINGR